MTGKIIYELIIGGYILGCFIFLLIIEKKMKNETDNIIRKQQIDSGMIICSIFWLPLVFFIMIYVFAKRIFGRNKK